MEKIIFVKSIKKSLLHPIDILINIYHHWLAKDHLKKYPQVAIFSFDHIGLHINLEGRYENQDLSLIRDYLESVIPNTRNTSALDIGANIGNHSIFFSEVFENIFAFEPNPRTFALLKINSEYASLKRNIRCLNFGLSDRNGRLFFKSGVSNVGASHVVSEIEKNVDDSVFMVDVKRADDIEELFGKTISLIKIDVEGHELAALKGAEELIKKNKPIILFEQHADDFINGTSDVVDYLKQLNYKFLTSERRYFLGDSSILKLFGLILRPILNYKLILTEKNHFQKRFYHMIVAVPIL